MVKYGDSGRAFRDPTPAWPTSTETATDWCRFGFFLPPSPSSTSSSLSQHEKDIKNKLSTDSPCFGPLSVGWSKEIIGEIVKIVHISEDDHEHLGEERVAGRASLVSSSLWSNGRRRRTIEACWTCPEWVQGKEQERHSRLPKKVVWAAKKWIFDRRGKLSLGCCAIGQEWKENKPKIKNKKNKKNEAEKRGRSSIRRARGSPIEKTYRKLHGKSSLYRKTR